MSSLQNVTFGTLGGGEAGRAIADSLHQQTESQLVCFDIKAMNEAACTALSTKALSFVPTCKELADTATIIISVVTADDALKAAQDLAPYLSEQHHFLDGNSVSPATKQAIAEIIHATGAHYTDMAIMAPIHPRGHQTPLLMAGDQEEALSSILTDFGFSYRWQGPHIGDASMVKMLRSILIKGMESLICECVTAAEGQGLDTEILTSAGKTLGIDDMPALADYVMERAARHGRRRAAELREVAKTLAELGLSNHMPTAIATHQDMVADMALSDSFDGDIPQQRALLAKAMRHAQGQD